MQTHPSFVTLGHSDLQLSPIGLGAWQWGDRFIWGYGRGYGEDDISAAFRASVQSGVNWVDTAEAYGRGQSERYLEMFLRQIPAGQVFVATKFFPYPWRLRQADLVAAARKSARRIGVDSIDLYQIHQPYSLVSERRWMRAMAQAHHEGLVRSVGVSNYSVERMLAAHDELGRQGLALASNQVRFSLLDRGPERSGLLEACRREGITLIAYSPLAQGWLTGKYTADRRPGGMRRRIPGGFSGERLESVLSELRRLGEAHAGKTPGQVALNWVLAKGAVAIPGAKTEAQARQNAGAMGWSLTSEQVETLDRLTAWDDAG